MRTEDDFPVEPWALREPRLRLDRLARTELPPGRTSSVFPTPVRAAVLADTWPEANEANKAASGKGLSHQGFNLCRKIAEVDEWVRRGSLVRVVEVHPEVSFAALDAFIQQRRQRRHHRQRLSPTRRLFHHQP